MKKPPGLPTPGQALLAFAAAFAAVVALGIVIARTGLPLAAAVLATPALTLLVALAAIRVFRLDPFRVFLLRPAKISDLLLTAPVAAALFVVSDQLATLGRLFIPVDEGVLRAAAELITADSALGWLVRLAGIACGAALAEELLFRGVILSGLRRFGVFFAVAGSALLFTVMHGLLLPNYFVAGLVLALAAAATGSILAPIAIHFFHNLAALLLYNLGGVETLADPLWVPPNILVPAAAIVAIVGASYLRRVAAAARPGEEAADPAKTEAGRRAAPETPNPPPGALGFGRELARVPPARRRLGFFVLGLAMLGGLGVAGGLFSTLGYLADPVPQRAAAIESLRTMSQEALAPGAVGRGSEIDAAFETLAELSREGRVGIRDLWRTARVVAAATADGEFGDGDVEALLMTVGAIRREAPGPR